MAQYKVPQDVEAEDKLLGPFTFRQFVYLLIAAAGIAGAWGLLQIFPLLALIPLPFVFFFGILALPVRKDQPMEVYLAAVVSFYMKPNRRIWTAGQRESTIKIIAPKKIEKSRTRNITEDEASHRLSFLANIVDTEGYAIRGESSMKDEYAAEADTVEDILDQSNPTIDHIIEQEQETRKQELVREMRTAMNRTDALIGSTPVQPQPRPIQAPGANYQPTPMPAPQPVQQPVMQPMAMPMPPVQPVYQQPAPAQSVQQLTQASLNQAAVNQQMQNLANNNTFSIQTIAQQAQRIQQQAQPQPTPQPVTQPVQHPSEFEQNFVEQVHNPTRPINNSMIQNNEAGLTAPVFAPMSIEVPEAHEEGQLYHPVYSDETQKKNNDDRPDLYGPPTAIFSA
jgi:hypothetical protein